MRKFSVLLTSFCLTVYSVFAQTHPIKGKVTDLKGIPLFGATITLKGTTKGSTADKDGSFTVAAAPHDVLVVSAIGYETKEIKVGTQTAVTVALTDDAKLLSDVVVTGVAQATSKEKLAFSLTKVNSEKINTVPALDLSQTLRGKVAGIQITQTQGDDGASVFLRGAKSMFGNISPLIVIDGFVTNFSLTDLNPQDVESIEVVKGAAASALYGTRAEGGVIQVITKKGRNTKGGLAVTIDNEVGVNNIQRIPKLATKHYYVTDDNDAFGFKYASGSTTTRIADVAANGFSVNLHPYKHYYNNTDALLGNNQYYSNYISVATSGDKYNAFISFRNQYTGGVAEPVDPNKKRSVSFRLQFRPNPKMESEVYLNYFNEKKPSSAVSSDGQGTFFAATLQWEPFINLAAKNANGDYNVTPDGWKIQGANLSNPMYEWSKREYTNNTDDYLAGGKLRYKLLKNLSIEALGSIRKQTYTSSNLYPFGYQTMTSDATVNNGYLSLSYSYYQMTNGQVQANYHTKFGDFDFSTTGKMVYENYYSKGFGVSGYDYSNSVEIYTIGNTRSDTRSGSGSDMFTSKTVNYGYYLNLQTSWRDKIFLDALARIDQSSRYGLDEQTAFFPRVALAYRITKDFNLGKAITELKARVNYGAAGSVPGYNNKNSIVNVSSSGITLSQLENTELKRSITKEWEFGLDAVLYNKINVQLNYAFARSSGDFITPPVFTPYQAAGVVKNFGVTKSRSLELEINGTPVTRKNFSWDFGVTFGRVRSEIKELGAGLPPFVSGLYRKEVGVSPFAMYGQKALTSLSELSVDKSTGLVTNAAGGTHLLDDFTVNKMGFVVLKSAQGTASELPLLLQKGGSNISTVIGDAQPDFQVGFTNTLTFFKNFTLYTTLDWKQGGQKYDQTTQYLSFDARSKVWQDYAEAGLPLAFLQGLYNGNSYTSFWVQKSNYVSLREVSLTYNLPVPKKAKLYKEARLSVIGRNLATWTKFNGTNPEGAWEYFPYPVYRTFSGRLILNF
ncbi:MAG: SusC/RagA family TonB-linked outer membrane protein [Chitinophagaceae bacterium]